MGLSFYEFCDLTWREYSLRKAGYERLENRDWEKFRSHAFKVIEPHIDPKKAGGLTKYNWFPIPGDPQGEELREINKELKEQEEEYVKKIYNERMTAVRNAGMKDKITA